jgi:NADPH:quinone reductase-like Zn-dependent oxidoreductase
MRAIVMRETGGPDVLRLEDWPVPAVAPGEVLVAAEAVGVNFVETRIRSGALLPMTPATLPEVPGGEAVGTVVAVGKGVDLARIGTRVATMGGSGAYAEYLTTPAEAAIPIPDSLSAADAVAVAAQGATALALLRAAGLTGRETVLIESAAGGVGGYLVQLAREFGARRVIATAGSSAKREMVLDLGADAVLDHYAPDWPSRVSEPVDVIFEFIGGACAGRLLDALIPGSGRMLFCGVLSGEPPAIAPMDLLMRGVGLIGCGGRPSDYSTGIATGWSAKVEAARPEILHRAATGGIRPRVDSTFPLADAAKAHQRLEERRAAGKVILLPALPDALRSQDGVMGMVRSSRSRGGSRAGFVDQDGPVVVEELGDVAGLVVIAGVEAVLLARRQLREVVAADEQGAAGCDGVQQAAQRGVLRLAGEREVLRRH